MKRAMSTVRVSRLMPGVDLGLLLVVLTCGTGALAWVTGPANSTLGGNPPPLAAPGDVREQVENLQERIDQLRRELDRKEDEAARLQAALDKIDTADLDTANDQRARMTQDLEQLRQHIEHLKTKLRQLIQEASVLQQAKGRTEQLRKAIDEITRQIEQLTRELQQMKRQSRILQRDIDDLRRLPVDRPTVTVDCNPVFQRLAGREAVLVMLAENKVAPIREPYYTISPFEGGQQAILVRPGETAERALAAGSDFTKMLGEAKSNNQYMFLFVDSSSFETFRTIRAFLQRQGVPFGWEPTHSTTILGGVGRGRIDAAENGVFR